jgi:hypothetical protein
MNAEQGSDNSICDDVLHLAERELAAFTGAVKELFGPEQARLAAEDWLDESELMDGPSQSTSREWRAVSVAAAARLTSRLNIALHRRTSFEAPLAIIGGRPGIGLETSTSIFD